MMAGIILVANTCLTEALFASMSTAYLQRKSVRLGQECLLAHVAM